MFRCLEKHRARDCGNKFSCRKCDRYHLTMLHDLPRPEASAGSGPRLAPRPEAARKSSSRSDSGVATEGASSAGERTSCTRLGPEVDSDEEETLGLPFTRTYLINVRHKDSDKIVRCLCIAEYQALRSYTHTRLPELLGIKGKDMYYKLDTLAGVSDYIHGQLIQGLEIQAVGGGPWHKLRPLKTNPYIADTRCERATRDVVANVPHLKHYASWFEGEDADAETLFVIGTTHASLLRSRTYDTDAPFVCDSPLGMALVGYLPRSSVPEHCVAYQGQEVKDRVNRTALSQHFNFIDSPEFLPRHERWDMTSSVFESLPDDEELTWSREDEEFVQIMKQGSKIREDGGLELPLPVRDSATKLPNNEAAAFHRTNNCVKRILRDPRKLSLCLDAMQAYIDRGHVELLTKEMKSKTDVLKWVLPVLAVQHPLKDSIRLVFDGKFAYKGVSLNDVLFTGPDFNNTLRGVLLRYRLHPVAFMLDIAHMFNCFGVTEEHREFLSFFWFKDNNPSNPLVLYRFTVHPFGACSSPSMAVGGLKMIAEMGREAGILSDKEYQFIVDSFYVDDGMDSVHSDGEAVKLISSVAELLAKHGLDIHKVRSNSRQVEDMFRKGSQDGEGSKVMQSFPRALGVQWDTERDVLMTVVKVPDCPFTRRGLLATTNALFDPLGMAIPALIEGRVWQRRILSEFPAGNKAEWDLPLPDSYLEGWGRWQGELNGEIVVEMPRCLLPAGVVERELHVFCDASLEAVACVIYMRSITADGVVHVGFVSACCKLAPRSASTVPRLELAAAVLAALHTLSTLKELKGKIDRIFMYSDSKVVLGYLSNQVRKFVKYVTRRVEMIIQNFPATLWRYVPTDINPADLGTRFMTPSQLKESSWIAGPDFLRERQLPNEFEYEACQDLPEALPERACTTKQVSEVVDQSVWSSLGERLSSWKRIVNVLVVMFKGARAWLGRARARLTGEHKPVVSVSFKEAENKLLMLTQPDSFPELFSREGVVDQTKLLSLSDKHPLYGLTPKVDAVGSLRLGGRLRQAVSDFEVKYPLILDSKHILVQRYCRYIHELTPHQGRIITNTHIRQQGVFVLGLKRWVGRLIRDCVTCRRLRKAESEQLMADLPTERVNSGCAFDHVGIDVFGPFMVHQGKHTRRALGTQKVFVLILNCLASRAIHVEPLEGMDTSSFINALRRFFAIRGISKSIRSDHGSNFLGALGQAEDFARVQAEVEARGIEWAMNPVGASHFGGPYERKIGAVRRVLEATMRGSKVSLSRDEFNTLLQEAVAVVNSTPLYAGSMGADEPLALSPSMLLTLKTPSGSDEDFSLRSDTFATGLKRWRRVQALADQFWKGWREHYLQELQVRRKWCKEKRDVSVGDVVLMKDKQAKRTD